MRFVFVWLILFSVGSVAADELSYLNQPCDPYYPGLHHAKLTTPQWIGDPDVEAVVILSIDDMRESGKYEAFLRPLIDRLKQIDGRAPISIFANEVDPQDNQLQTWLAEGLSLETHTVDHPCPLLCDGDLAKAKSTYDRCVDQLCDVPGSKPVAFRMPCCDSLNTPSPRFWTEIFAKKTTRGNFLSVDSSVFNVFTPDDPDLTKDITHNEDGSLRFRSYLPFPSFVNTIENYPYPYIIDGTCWEFPCVVPSDWEAQHVQQPNNPKTVADWQVALDATVKKQGVMPIVFHPHDWIRNDQLVKFVDYAVNTYGKKVKFMTFAEAIESINEHLLGGVPLRTGPKSHRAILIDVNRDGFMDVMRRGDDQEQNAFAAFVWNSKQRRYESHVLPRNLVPVQFALKENVVQVFSEDTGKSGIVWHRWDNGWKHVDVTLSQLENAQGFTTRDLDNDGTSEIFTSTGHDTTMLDWQDKRLVKLGAKPPVDFAHLGTGDRGTWFVDLDSDQREDLVLANGTEFGVWKFEGKETGWTEIRSGKAEQPGAIPSIAARDGTNNGAWFHSDHLWVQNENTHKLPDLVDRVSYDDLLAKGNSSSETDVSILGTAKNLEDSLATFEVVAGGKLEVVASEPQIQDPVAFDWGPNGELWVVEMSDYPNGANWHRPGDPKGDAGGRVKLLYDKDGDGRFETSHVFLDGLGVPTGVKAFRNGVLVSVIPDIIYAEDTNGDNVADKQTVLFSGLAEGNEQHRANGLRWGLDHWIHVANGESGGNVKSEKTGAEKSIRGRDFKFQPDQGLIEVTAGQSQFGRSRDNMGNWFGGNNSNPVYHFVLDQQHLARNPHVSPPSSRRDIAEEPGAAPIFPKSKTVTRFNDFDRADRFTSACSTEISRNDADVTQFVYVCEPVHNLVHRSELMRDGVSFASRRAVGERESEFLTSTDNWFRPVMVRSGPDEAIWVADMYRQVIEHPEWIPMEWQKKIDHLAGSDKGRIYRVVFGNRYDNQWKGLRSLDTEQLVQRLDSPNGVVRDMVQAELYARKPTDGTEALRTLYEKTNWPMARIPALHLLKHVGGLDETFLAKAIPSRPVYASSSQAHKIDRHWLEVALPTLKKSPGLRDKFFYWLGDAKLSEDEQVFIAYALGEIPDDRSTSALANLAIASVSDPYRTAAVMSSVPSVDFDGMFSRLQDFDNTSPTPIDDNHVIVKLMATAVGMENSDALNGNVVSLITDTKNLSRRAAWLAQLLRIVKRHGKPLRELFEDESYVVLQDVGRRGRAVAQDKLANMDDRETALAVFGSFPEEMEKELVVLQSLLTPQSAPQLQIKATKLLRRMGNVDAAKGLFARWETLSPTIRKTLVAESLQDAEWTNEMLNSMERGDVSAKQIDLQQQSYLRRHQEEDVRERVAKLFQPIPSDRTAVIQRYQDSNASPDAANGKQVFQKQCTACHLLEGIGKPVGPNLTALTDKSKPAMLAAILDPNRAVEEKFLNYVLVVDSGQVYEGMLAEETATSITLATATGERKTILRKNIEALKATGKSLMPEGLEQVLNEKDMTDVIAYVQSVKANRKRFNGNEPQLAPVRDDGSLRMFAMHAEIYGPDLEFESKYRNLGYWKNDRDRAVWTIKAPKAGAYEVNLDYACAPVHNNRFQLTVNGQKLSGEVRSTGSWDNYDSTKIGTVLLPAETVQVTLSSEGPIEGFLFDVRTIVLWPEE